MKKLLFRKITGIFFILIFFVNPKFVLAQGVNYFEFNPDYFKTKSLSVSGAGTIYEIFLPANEFFGGADFWFDNAGNAGDATFELYNQNDVLLRTKTINIPHIDPIAGGQRTHVGWDSQVSVVGSNKYKIRILSVLPQFRIYYADRIKFLGHNEPYISTYANGAAEIGGEEQDFSFKYALYESVESSAPVISNLTWSVISYDQMILGFNTNEPVDYKLEYGPIGQGFADYVDFSGEYSFCNEGIFFCSMNVPVFQGKEYQYNLTVKDLWGNQNLVTGTFTSGQAVTPVPIQTITPANFPESSSESGSPSPMTSVQEVADSTSPVISNLKVVSLTDSLVKVSWTTDEAANSHLLISTPFFITITDSSDSTLELEHVLKASSGLGYNSSYVATVTSNDLAGNQSKASIDFTTPAYIPGSTPSPNEPPISQPFIQNDQQEGGVLSSGSGSIGVIQWSLPSTGEQNDGYRVDVFDKGGKFVKTVIVPAGFKEAQVSDLVDGKYSVIVYSNNDGVFEKISKPVELKIGESFWQRLVGFWWVFLSLLAGLGYLVWRNYNRKNLTTPSN